MTERLTWTCDTCHQPVDDGDGYIHVNHDDVRRRETARNAWQAEQPGDGYVDLQSFAQLPPDAEWRVDHRGCDPAPESSDYVIDVHRARTHRELLDWTLHLCSRKWFDATDWTEFIPRRLGTRYTSGHHDDATPVPDATPTLAHLLENVDDIDGMRLKTPDVDIWLHTSDQVVAWLKGYWPGATVDAPTWSRPEDFERPTTPPTDCLHLGGRAVTPLGVECMDCGTKRAVDAEWPEPLAAKPSHLEVQADAPSRDVNTPAPEAVEVLQSLWADGNATGLDGYVGPGRGTEPAVDPQAEQSRDDAVEKALAALARVLPVQADQTTVRVLERMVTEWEQANTTPPDHSLELTTDRAFRRGFYDAVVMARKEVRAVLSGTWKPKAER